MSAGELLIYGAGGHGRVIADIVEQEGKYELAGFLDDHARGDVQGRRIWGDESVLASDRWADAWLILGIGDIAARARVAARIGATWPRMGTAVHPSAQIGRNVEIGAGTVVMAQTAINTGARIGSHAIINTGATVDHDCVIGEFTHLSPGVHLAGGVRVGSHTLVGIGASIIQGVTIGDHTRIGAGAAVIHDVPDGATVVGIPARPIRSGH